MLNVTQPNVSHYQSGIGGLIVRFGRSSVTKYMDLPDINLINLTYYNYLLLLRVNLKIKI